jgi:hypothetical protein
MALDKYAPDSSYTNQLSRLMGMELEIANWGGLAETTPRSHFDFRVVRDGSVVPSGKEMVVAPMGGDEFLRGVFELGKLLATNDCSVNNSCGFHVHVNAQDMNWWALRRLIQLYTRIEGDIYRHIISAERAGNCGFFKRKLELWQTLSPVLARAKSVNEIKHAILAHLYQDYNLIDKHSSVDVLKNPSLGERWTGVKAEKYGGEARYLGLNLHSYFYRGTVEWRMFEGTVSLDDIVNWPLVCGWIVETCINKSDSEVGKIHSLRQFSESYLPLPVQEWVSEKLAGPANEVMSDMRVERPRIPSISRGDLVFEEDEDANEDIYAPLEPSEDAPF